MRNAVLTPVLGSIHTCDLIGENYCENYLLNNGLYCTTCKWVHSHLLFGHFLCGPENNNIMGCDFMD